MFKGEWGNRFQWLALGIYSEVYLRDRSAHHQDCAGDIAVKNGGSRTSLNQVTEQHRSTDAADQRSSRIKNGNRKSANVEWKDFAYGQVGGTRRRRCDEENKCK